MKSRGFRCRLANVPKISGSSVLAVAQFAIDQTGETRAISILSRLIPRFIVLNF